MKIVAAIAPEQEQVIERILRHLQLWDPPWKRQRKARGPPHSSGTGGSVRPASRETIDPIIDDDLHTIDFIPPEDDDTPA